MIQKTLVFLLMIQLCFNNNTIADDNDWKKIKEIAKMASENPNIKNEFDIIYLKTRLQKAEEEKKDNSSIAAQDIEKIKDIAERLANNKELYDFFLKELNMNELLNQVIKQTHETKYKEIIQDSNMIIGNKDGKKEIIMFSAIDCFHCIELINDFKRMCNKHKDYKIIILMNGNEDVINHLIAVSNIDQQKWLTLLDKIKTNTANTNKEMLTKYIDDLGIDKEQFKKELEKVQTSSNYKKINEIFSTIIGTPIIIYFDKSSNKQSALIGRPMDKKLEELFK